MQCRYGLPIARGGADTQDLLDGGVRKFGFAVVDRTVQIDLTAQEAILVAVARERVEPLERGFCRGFVEVLSVAKFKSFSQLARCHISLGLGRCRERSLIYPTIRVVEFPGCLGTDRVGFDAGRH